MTAPWHIPGELLPAEQQERMSVDAKLTAAMAALMIVRDRAVLDREPSTGKRWSQRDRLEYIATICENALRRIR
jgi:hypothetical protein